MTHRIARLIHPEASALGAVGAGSAGKTAKVYLFPTPSAVYTADVKMEDARAYEMGAHPAVILEIAAAVLAFAFWLVWRLTHLSTRR